jgi:hypothetical protein
MSAHQVRQTMQGYLDALVARGDYGRFLAEGVQFEIVGTDQRMRGAEQVEQGIRSLHEVSFDARPEVSRRVTAAS